MEYRRLGNSGLKISVLSFGSWVTFVNQLDKNTATQCMDYAYNNGVNFFDNAEAYAAGQSEKLMGKIIKNLKWTRDSYIVSSKVFWGGEKPTQRGLCKKHIHDACHAALKRLKVEYLDLYFCHRPDPDTPILETIYAMNDLISQGKVMYWGTSEWSAKDLNQTFKLCEEYNMRYPTMEQPQYNILSKDRVEIEYKELFEKYSLGTTVWSPLASGLLTGKYNNGVPEKSRFNVKGYEWLKDEIENTDFKKIKEVGKLAKSLDITQTQLSILWCLKNKNVSSVILGASSIEQLKENLETIKLIEKIDLKALNKI
tara:strand:- start:444 stop:1379 length:936 start_codon:yes stop_codon:yes gene_type:complete